MEGRLAGFCVGNPTKNNAKKLNISIFRGEKANKNIHTLNGVDIFSYYYYRLSERPVAVAEDGIYLAVRTDSVD